MTPEQRKALEEYQAAIDAYTNGPRKQYRVEGELTPEEIEAQTIVARQLGDSAMGDIATDPRYKEAELAALRDLEDQAKNGFTAADRADMARTENQTNRANRGRIEAIKQNMAARGGAGSGMELLAQMQSSQDANEIAAIRALEREGMMQDRKRSATRDLGQMSASLQSRDFAQQAAKAEAADQIARFNAQNRMDTDRFNAGSRADRDRFNAQSRMGAQQANLGARQNVSNMNVGAANDFSQNVMNAQMSGAQMSYNAATEAENRRLLEEQERRRRKAAKNQAMGQMIGGGIGAVAGGMYGGPAGAAMGASAGSSLGGSAAGAFGGYAHGGVVPGEAPVEGDHPANDIVPAWLSPGEVVIPRSKADAVQDLLDAAARLSKKGK